ncbi:MAG: hypothetical protein DUD32_12545 [Lactobacillus sp.]|nr:MAG: hypothetical protein DUD32_12545 [Lactobacillus sp.]
MGIGTFKEIDKASAIEKAKAYALKHGYIGAELRDEDYPPYGFAFYLLSDDDQSSDVMNPVGLPEVLVIDKITGTETLTRALL